MSVLAPPSPPAARALRLAYVTSRFPHGPGEAFLAPEARALGDRVEQLWLVPMRPRGGVVHEDARPLLGRALSAPLASAGVLAAASRQAARDPAGAVAALSRVGRSRSRRILAKNLAVVPKGLWLARQLDRLGVEHVHVQWGGASSTMAMLAAEQVGLPWSMTLHRWDIGEDNLLAEKLGSAAFVRVISEFGAEQVRRLVPGARVEVLHLGVDVGDAPARPRRRAPGEPFTLLAVGSLTPQKGHATLLDALPRATAAAGPGGVTLEVAGDGPLRNRLAARCAALGIADRVRFLGTLPHVALLAQLGSGRWDALVHSSPEGDGLSEGIPVALMEAMAAGLPVIAFASGGVTELLRPPAGVLVPRQSAAALADAIGAVAADRDLAVQLAAAGRRRICDEFDAAPIAAELAARIAAAGSPRS